MMITFFKSLFFFVLSFSVGAMDNSFSSIANTYNAYALVGMASTKEIPPLRKQTMWGSCPCYDINLLEGFNRTCTPLPVEKFNELIEGHFHPSDGGKVLEIYDITPVEDYLLFNITPQSGLPEQEVIKYLKNVENNFSQKYIIKRTIQENPTYLRSTVFRMRFAWLALLARNGIILPPKLSKSNNSDMQEYVEEVEKLYESGNVNELKKVVHDKYIEEIKDNIRPYRNKFFLKKIINGLLWTGALGSLGCWLTYRSSLESHPFFVYYVTPFLFLETIGITGFFAYIKCSDFREQYGGFCCKYRLDPYSLKPLDDQ